MYTNHYGGEILEDLKSIIAGNISCLRKKNKMTQAELADKLCYSDKAISKWERGESIPDVFILKQVADLFSVTVDYLLSQHDGETEKFLSSEKNEKKNRNLITAISIGAVWFIATAAFVIMNITDVSISVGNWMLFIYAVPVCLTVALVFNSIWGKKLLRFVIISLLMWSLLVSVCLSLRSFDIWLLLVIGVPAEVIIILVSMLGGKLKKTL